MSIAVAVSKHGKTVVAADTQENFGDRKVLRTNHRSAKIMKVGASYLAQTGWGIYENILTDYLSKAEAPRLRNETEVFTFFVRFWRQLHKKYSFVNDQADDDDKTPFADLDASFLVVNRSGIFLVSGNMSVTQFNEYYAIGSGGSYALGALHALYNQDLEAEEIARGACGAATNFDIYCGGELDLYHVRGGAA